MEELREVLGAQQSTVPALVDAGLMHLIRCTCPQGGETLSGSRAGAWVPKGWAIQRWAREAPHHHLHGPVLREACHPCPDSSPPFPGGLTFPGCSLQLTEVTDGRQGLIFPQGEEKT